MKCQFKQPYPIYTTVLTGKNLPPHVGYRFRIPPDVYGSLDTQSKQEDLTGKMKQKLIQTMFRDSEAQTDPYEVDVAEETNHGLEILTLGWLSWDNGLPAGMNEINSIERARQRRAWESALPVPFGEKSKEIRNIIMETIEINEWNYREQLIAAIGSLRMELAEKLLKETCQENKLKYEKRISKYIQAKREEKNKKIQNLRTHFNREIRKLTFDRQKVNRKYHRWNIIRQFADKTSELYAPQMRFGEDPRHRHEKISQAFRFSKVFRKLEILNLTTGDIPENLKPAFDINKNSKPRKSNKELCTRATKWTEQNLEILHDELKQIRRRRQIAPRACYLKKKVAPHATESGIQAVIGLPDEEEECFQACLFLQKTIKGRAIQAVMFEGRVKCQELIEELKSTHALQKSMEGVKTKMRRRVYRLQREAEINDMQERRKKEILCALEGKTTGDMLDFLAKELLRLQDERKTHALALAADQERHKREAAEAGRRQVEEQRRREHDEMFKQVTKIHQNNVQALLEDAMTSSRCWLANRIGREYVTKMAKKIDQAAKESATTSIFMNSNYLREEEIIADLIHNFALPEAEKRLVRKRMKDKQKNYLRVCHDEVYSNIENVVKGRRNNKGELLPLPMKGKYKIPPLVRVQYLHLKRLHESSSSSSGKSVANEKTSQSKIQMDEPEYSTDDLLKEFIDRENWSTGFSRQEVILEKEEPRNQEKDNVS